MTLSPYRKALVNAAVQIVLAVLIATADALNGGGLGMPGILAIVVAALSTAQTYLVPNVPELPWAKTAVTVALAAVQSVAALYVGDAPITAAAVFAAVVGSAAVYLVPNVPVVTDTPGEHAVDRLTA